MPLRALLFGVVLLSLATMGLQVTSAPVPALWSGLTPGAHLVGYRRLVTAAGVIHVWYPAAGGGRTMRVRDYVAGDSADLVAFLRGAGIASPVVDSLFDSSLYAVWLAAPLPDTVPLIAVAQGNGQDAMDQAVLCEYLASQGLVVFSVASPMRSTPMEHEDQVGEFAERQSAELTDAARVVAAVFPADTMRIGVVGHSFGARAALLLAMHDPRVRALVSLDGGIGTATAQEAFQRAPWFDPDALLPPTLHFYEQLDTFMHPDFTLLKRLHIKRLEFERVVGMHHVHFTTYGFVAARFPAFAAATHATGETRRSVRVVAERTARFLVCNLRAGGPATTARSACP